MSDDTIASILRAFADLTPSGSKTTLDVTEGGFFAVRPEDFRQWTIASLDLAHSGNLESPTIPDDRGTLHRFASIDALHRDERLLRQGWVFLCGPITVDGHPRKLCLPLISAPIRLRKALIGGYSIVNAGDPRVLPLVSDPDRRHALETNAQFGGGAFELMPGGGEALIDRLPRLRSWISDVVAAAGLHLDAIVGPDQPIPDMRDGNRLVAVVRSGIFAARDVDAPDLSSTLRGWASVEGLGRTALAHVYLPGSGAPSRGGDTDAAHAPDDGPVASPLPLDPMQRQVVRRARDEPLTTVSGPPGAGKTHTVAALALDAVARGGSVLIATQSGHAANVIADMLDRTPGPTPVLFGDAERRRELTERLADGLSAPLSKTDLARVKERLDDTTETYRGFYTTISSILGREVEAASAARESLMLPWVHEVAPGLTDETADLEAIERQVDELEQSRARRGFFARRRARKAERWLRSTLRAPRASIDDVRRAIEIVHAVDAAARLSVAGGTAIGPLWKELARAADAVRHALGERLAALPQERTDDDGRGAVADLATALRSGPAHRRQLFRDMHGSALTRALPLWVGTVQDVDDLLPRVPGLFELVVLDEASQIDQIRAATTLARGRRGVVVGDPRQLRHVSFLGDDELAATLDAHGLGSMSGRLDVRRASAYDVAAGASPVTWLDQHHRSVPHLIAFSARHFYDRQLHLATRHPATEAVDAIEVVRVEGQRAESGVNQAEIQAVADVLDRLREQGRTSIGVVSPLRAQADALEEMLLSRYGVDEIESMGLRVGTVHAFQGSERETIVASLAITDVDPPGSRRFVEDANLFNVLITRARSQMILVTSLSRPTGVVAEYLAQADSPPKPYACSDASSEWTDRLATELVLAGLAVRCDYPVGRWTTDLCVGDGAGAAGVICTVHRDGPEAHIERQLALLRKGWRLLEAFPSHYDDDAIRAALDLTVAVRPR